MPVMQISAPPQGFNALPPSQKDNADILMLQRKNSLIRG
jgi:hypothetical protein